MLTRRSARRALPPAAAPSDDDDSAHAPTYSSYLSLAFAGAKVIEMVEESGRVLCGLTLIRDAVSQELWVTPLRPRSRAPPPPPAGERRV